jgi:hypothetical protein
MITTTSLRNGRDTRPPLPAALGPSRNSPRVLVVRDHNDKTEAEMGGVGWFCQGLCCERCPEQPLESAEA